MYVDICKGFATLIEHCSSESAFWVLVFSNLSQNRKRKENDKGDKRREWAHYDQSPA